MPFEVYATAQQEKGHAFTQSFKQMRASLAESGLKDVATFLEQARAEAASLVKGLHATEESMADPRVFTVPTDTAYEVGFVFDTETAGSSLVASPIELPWLG